MKKYFFTLTMLLTLNTAYSSYPNNLSGIYDCNSIEVDTNQNLQAVMTLKKNGDTYSIKSIFNDGSAYIGTGIYDQAKHYFSLVFLNPTQPKEVGVAFADVNENYAMNSTWTYLNKTTVAHATCAKRS